MHSSCPAPLLSCILHVMHPTCREFSCPAPHLSCIPHVLPPFCHAFLMSCPHSVMHSLCPASLLPCTPHVLHPSCHAFLMSCIPPAVFSSSHPTVLHVVEDLDRPYVALKARMLDLFTHGEEDGILFNTLFMTKLPSKVCDHVVARGDFFSSMETGLGIRSSVFCANSLFFAKNMSE